MLVTDWPTDTLNGFWADHSILAAASSTLFLVGIGYLIWEQAEQQKQELLAAGLSGAGLGGIVDHMIDAEMALAMLSSPTSPAYVGWDSPDKPLRWMRAFRDSIRRNPHSARPAAEDPRSVPVDLPNSDSTWRELLVDQAVRRVLTAMRDWSPLIGRSNDGTTALILLSEIRKDLMELASHLEAGEKPKALSLIVVLRQRLRILAYFFEDVSRNATGPSTRDADTTPLRREVLLSLHPLPARDSGFGWNADLEEVPHFSRTWRQRLESVCKTLEADLKVLDVDQVRELARARHAGQVTKQGVDYFDAHLDPIATRLAEQGDHAVMAGLLHDVLEDTATTAEELLALGVPKDVVSAVVSVSKRPQETYDDLILRATANPLGRLVKLADNAQNLADNPALAEQDPETAARLMAKYERARAMLLGSEH